MSRRRHSKDITTPAEALAPELAHHQSDLVKPNPMCPLCAPSWPLARPARRIRIRPTTAAAVAVVGAAAGYALGYTHGWNAL